MTETTKNAAKKGRPATGKKTKTIGVSIPIPLAKKARAAALKADESFSAFIQRALVAILATK